MAFSALLLAAGESTRMGTSKPLLPWGSGTLIAYHLAELAASVVNDVVVVLGHQAEQVRPDVDRAGVTVVVNEEYHLGRAGSVRAGAQAISEQTEAVVVLNVDQPRPHHIIDQLVQAYREAPCLVLLPAFRGHRGHPPVFAGSLVPELRAVEEEGQGLRAVTWRHADGLRTVEIESPLIFVDMNGPAEYRQAHELFFGVPAPS